MAVTGIVWACVGGREWELSCSVSHTSVKTKDSWKRFPCLPLIIGNIYMPIISKCTHLDTTCNIELQEFFYSWLLRILMIFVLLLGERQRDGSGCDGTWQPLSRLYRTAPTLKFPFRRVSSGLALSGRSLSLSGSKSRVLRGCRSRIGGQPSVPT